MIQVDGLSYRYPGADTDVLKDISFECGKGEIFGFLGPSGAGKSTTQKVLYGLLKGFRGSVRVMEKELKGIDRSFYEKIGVAFEFPNLYQKLTARENLELFASFYSVPSRDPDELLDMLLLGDDKNTRVAAFSKGMKMRLNFARALINQPEILFLDEPTAGLDPANARRMKDIILDLKESGVSIFLTTHRMDDAEELCERIAFMVEGHLPVIDAVRDLKLKYGRKELKVRYLEGSKETEQVFALDEIKGKAFQEILKDREILTIHTREASLEDIFLQVTGQSLTA